MKLRNLGVLGGIAALTLTACGGTATTAPSSAPGTTSTGTTAPASQAAGGLAVKIGIELPMTGGEAPNGVPTANGVALALSKIQVPGFTVTINQQDDAVNGKHDPSQGAKNMTTLANDTSVLFVVGPYNSNVAQAEIPVSNAAGLMQCSPANTNPGLTKTWGGVDPKTLRPTNPDKISYVRVATTDDLQGAGGADIAYNLQGKKTAYVLDDTQTYGKGIADVFETQFKALGGTILGHDGPPDTTTDYTTEITTIKGKSPEYIYYGGVTTSGLGLFRKQSAQAGLTVPMGGGDGINDGSVATASSFLQIAGDAGDANTFSTVAATHDIPGLDAFNSAYKAMFNTDPGSYSAAAYACTQVFLQALKAVGTGKTDLAAIREAIRAYVATPANTYDTQLGTLSFDAGGDTSQKVISYYGFDAATKDWKFIKQRDFTKEPLAP